MSFARPFSLKGYDRALPAGSYEIVSDEELIEGLSFPVYRRISTSIMIPGKHAGDFEMFRIDPLELDAARKRAAPDTQSDT